MNVEVHDALCNLIRAIAYEKAHPALNPDHPITTITLSRTCGSGGEAVADGLAAALGLRVYDREVLNAVAESTGIDQAVLEKLDERIDVLKGAWLRYFLTGENLFKDSYRRNLVNAVLSIAGDGGIIVGRGAHLILAHRPAYRVRIIGSPERCAERIADSPERCAERIADAEDLSVSEALESVNTVNAQRARFLRTLYNVEINDPVAFDLVINSDRHDVDAMVRVILAGLGKTGPS